IVHQIRTCRTTEVICVKCILVQSRIATKAYTERYKCFNPLARADQIPSAPDANQLSFLLPATQPLLPAVVRPNNFCTEDFLIAGIIQFLRPCFVVPETSLSFRPHNEAGKVSVDATIATFPPSPDSLGHCRGIDAKLPARFLPLRPHRRRPVESKYL